MTEAEFKAELKELRGGYLFFGGEDYLKYVYSKEVAKKILDGTFDEFNHIILYAEDFSAVSLSQAISLFPMMAEKKLVEVRGVDFTSLKKDVWEALDEVLSTLSENDHTVLIVRADNDCFNAGRLPDHPSEQYKLLSKYLTPVEFEFPSPARLKSWVLRHFSDNGVSCDPSISDKLVTVAGHDMWVLSTEIDKLSNYVKMNGRQEVTEKDVEDVSARTIEYEDFQLTNALLEKNKSLVFETLYRQKSSHEPPMAILSSIIRMFSEIVLIESLYSAGNNKKQISLSLKIHEFKVGKYLRFISSEKPKKLIRAFELCNEADIKSKSQSNLTSYIAVERLVSALCALFCR